MFAGEFGFGRGLEVALRPVFDPVREDPRFLRQIELAGVLAEYRAAWTQVLTWSRKAEGQP